MPTTLITKSRAQSPAIAERLTIRPSDALLHEERIGELAIQQAQLNEPSLLRTEQIAGILTNVCTTWARQPVLSLRGVEGESISQSWSKLAKALKALSSTDLIIGWGENADLVERPGQRALGRRGELSHMLSLVRVGHDHLDWSRLSVEDRVQVAGLMLLCLKGSPLEEVNRIESGLELPYTIARSLALIEKFSDKLLFDVHEKEILPMLRQFHVFENQALKIRNLEKLILVEGRRQPFYVERRDAAASGDTLGALARRFGGGGHSDLSSALQNAVDQRGIDEVISSILLHAWQFLSDESIVVANLASGHDTAENRVRAWGVVAGQPFSYEAVIEPDSRDATQVTVQGKKEAIRRIPIRVPAVEQYWRRTSRDVSEFPPSVPELVQRTRPRIQALEAKVLRNEDLSAIEVGEVTYVASVLFRRLVNHNMAAGLNGEQWGTRSIQPGWHLAYDRPENGETVGALNNPGHAMGGVQSMIRMPVFTTPFSNIRFWRENRDESRQLELADVPAAVAYRDAVDTVLAYATLRKKLLQEYA